MDVDGNMPGSRIPRLALSGENLSRSKNDAEMEGQIMTVENGSRSEPEDCLAFLVFVECGVLQYAGWRSILRCRQLGTTWNTELNAEHWWKEICLDFAAEYGLYFRTEPFGSKWSAVFERLWNHRFKFNPSEMPPADFNITVTARFRPGAAASSRSDYFLPLHQRLKLRKPGEILTFKDAENGLDDGAIKSIAGATGATLPPELVRALLDAARLGHAASRAEADGTATSVLWEGNALGNDGTSDSDGVRGRMEQRFARPGNADGGEDDRAFGEGPNGGHPADNHRRNRGAAAQPRAARHAEHLARLQHQAGASRRGGQARVVSIDPSRVCMYVPGQGVRNFLFEHVLADTTAQHTVYDRVAQPVVSTFLNGLDSCLLAYGQTGSGKTYTVFGPDGVVGGASPEDSVVPGAGIHPDALPSQAGVVLRAVCEALHARTQMAAGGVRCQLAVKYVQIYQEDITDLITNRRAELRAVAGGAFALSGCTEHPVDTIAEALELLRIGEKNKVFAATMMNDHSSRAHTVFILSATQVKLGSSSRAKRGTYSPQDILHAEESLPPTASPLVTSQLYLVDLAGCEQLKQSQATGQQRDEAVGINYSLMVLKKVIRALVECKPHVPYRESVLTQLLKSSLGGSARTSAIITGAPEDAFAAQTLQAMRFGEAIAQVTNTLSADALSHLSAEQALASLHEALARSRRTLVGLAAKGKHQLSAYAKAQRLENELARQVRALEDLQRQ